jgi:signal transduction histidine kinase
MRLSDQAHNRLSVLKKLRAAEPISRTDLAQLSGLNGGTITAIVRDLVALHGGELSLDEAPGGGLVVTVNLPAALS